VLHIYLEGDGRPWRNRYTVNTDPTPHTPLMPALMAQDSAPKLFLGRPCYHGLAATPGCAPQHWTQGRYGEPVVASLAAALQTYLVQQPQVQRLVFIGHSGGGTLALLLAARFPQTLAVITLAANFDHAAWTAQAGYTPLSTSLYPLELPPLPVVQWHYAGARDTQVPPAISAAITRTQPQAHFSLYPQADHTCCWAAATTWREILAPLQALETAVE
jgi:pimeloyl-ACP methyl ester carboxylesterase